MLFAIVDLWQLSRSSNMKLFLQMGITLEDAFFSSMILCSLGLLISSIENLFCLKTFSSSGILSWKTCALVTKWTRMKIFNSIFSEKTFHLFLYFNFLISLLFFTLSCFKILSVSVFILQFLVFILFAFRTFYGLDGAYHMNLVVLLAGLLMALFGIHSDVGTACLWFVSGQLILSYLIAGVRKLFSPIWQSGQAIKLIFGTEAYGNHVVYTIVEKSRFICLILSWSVIIWETLFPIVLFSSMKLVLALLVMGFLFHLMNGIFMGLNNFIFAFVSAYPILWYLMQDSLLIYYVLGVMGHIICPALLILWIWGGRSSNWWTWSIKIVSLAIYNFNLFFIGVYPFYYGHLGKYSILLLSLGSIVYSFIKMIQQEKLKTKVGVPAKLGFILLSIFSSFLAWEVLDAFKGSSPSSRVVDLEFPLKNGSYYVVHGGSDASINHHFKVDAQRFALDIVKLNDLGMRSHRLIPENLTDYFIFKDEVYSPAAGKVIKVVSTMEDLDPATRDPSNVAGNHIVLKKEGTNELILLAHLLKNSIVVKEGDVVKTGQFLARIGNSGNTTEPHLHIHCCIDSGNGDYLSQAEPVSILFKGSYLVRNHIYTSN